jgi:choline kinase
MKGIILAAGRGARLDGSQGDLPKCLISLGDCTLLDRQVHCLRQAGIEEIAVIVGFGADQVRQSGGRFLQYVENTVYDKTNSMYSLWLAREFFSDGFLVMNSDVLFHPQMLRDLLTARHDDALLVAFRDEKTPPYGDEEMKVKVRRGQVVDISKQMEPAEADGENVGMAKFSAAGARLLLEQMDALVSGGNLRQWAPRAFLDFAKRKPLYAVGTRGFPWTEIDFPEDYQRALNEILPLISEEQTVEQP